LFSCRQVLVLGEVSYNGPNLIIINFIGVALLIFILSVFRMIVVL